MRRIAFIVIAVGLLGFGLLFAANFYHAKDDVCAILDSTPKAELLEEFEGLDDAEERVRFITEGAGRDETCKSTYWQAFEAKPARETLGAEDFKSYQRALEQSDCATASALLLNAFPSAHPRAPNILEDKDHHAFWTYTVLHKYYPELDYCRILRQLREAQTEIERHGIAAERYHSDWNAGHITELPFHVSMRNFAISSLIRHDDYPPALIALAKLSHEGEVIRFVPEYQYFLLQKALSKGMAQDELAGMLAAAEAKLQPSQIEDLKQQALKGKYTGPKPITK